MHINFFYEDTAPPPRPIPMPVFKEPAKKYGFLAFCWDLFMVFLTCGLWLIWIFVREMRRR